jgi:hypothetical protein
MTQPEVTDQLVTAVEDAAKDLALFKVRHANLVDEAFELIHAAMKLLSGGGGGVTVTLSLCANRTTMSTVATRS